MIITNKKSIAVVTGGYSGEDIISFLSSNVVIKHIPSDKYEVTKVIINRKRWLFEKNGIKGEVDKNDFTITIDGEKSGFDCVFVALHGTPAEDGKLPAYFDMIGIPYTCCKPSVSTMTFNKGYTVSLLNKYGVLTAESIILKKTDTVDLDEIINNVGLPCFVKPNEGGSSIGISKVNLKEDLAPSIEKAFQEDETVLIEKFLDGTEITCGVTKIHGKIQALGVTEIVSQNDFFDFDAKYNDQKTQEITPARISNVMIEKCKKDSEYIFKTLGCSGIIRIDYILCKDKLYVLEINTIPGLSDKSIVPKMAQYIGLSLEELFTEQIINAIAFSR